MGERGSLRAALAAVGAAVAALAAWAAPAGATPLPMRELTAGAMNADSGGLSRLDVSRAQRTDAPLVAVIDAAPARSLKAQLGKRLVRVEDIVSQVTRGRVRSMRSEHANQVVDLVAGEWNGACPTCRVALYSVLWRVGDSGLTDDALVARAVDRATALGARVINLSLGGDGRALPVLSRAIDRALGRGVVVVAAAGNRPGQARLIEPANHPGVLSVGSVTRAGENTFSGQRIGPTLWAQGSDLEADGLSVMGSSFAAPQVAGVAAVMTARPGWRPRNRAGVRRLVARLRSAATVLPDGRRLLDAAAVFGKAPSEVFVGPYDEDVTGWNVAVDLRSPAPALVCAGGQPFSVYEPHSVTGRATWSGVAADTGGVAGPTGWTRVLSVTLGPSPGRTLWQLTLSRADDGTRPVVTLDPNDCLPPAPPG